MPGYYFKSLNKRFTRIRCGTCRIPLPHCICGYIPEIKTPFLFYVLTHPKELDKPTSTGRLITQVLSSSKLVVWDRMSMSFDRGEPVRQQGFIPCLVYPGKGSVSLNIFRRTALKNQGTPAFVLLDGTWKQARRMMNHSSYLRRLPLVSLNPRSVSAYRLRKQHDPTHLSTVETAIEILSEAGEADASEKLRAYFQLFQSYYLQTKLNKSEIDFPPASRILGHQTPVSPVGATGVRS